MFSNIYKYLLILLLTFVSAGAVFSQAENGNPETTKKTDFPDGIQETLAKSRIKEEEKKFKELIKQGEETVKLSEELTKSFEENKQISTADIKKIELLEKLIKKIRQKLGTEEDKEETAEDKPASILTALTNIKDKTTSLLAELKKTTRYSISVIAVESSNAVWKLVKFLKFNKN